MPGFHTLMTYMEMGGFVMWPLTFVSMLLWYALIYRLMTIKTTTRNPRKLISSTRKKISKGKLPDTTAITERATEIAVTAAVEAQSRKELKSCLNLRFRTFRDEMGKYQVLVRSLVMVAPLLGLLGTVDGMIETFNSLGEMALFTQSGGIAGGISRALFTTQIGLAVSIPGLLIGRIIDRQQVNISRELDQIRDLVCSRKQFKSIQETA